MMMGLNSMDGDVQAGGDPNANFRGRCGDDDIHFIHIFYLKTNQMLTIMISKSFDKINYSVSQRRKTNVDTTRMNESSKHETRSLGPSKPLRSACF